MLEPQDQIEAIEEMVIVAVPVSRAYAGWAEFQSLFLYLSGKKTANPAAGSQHSDGRGPRPLDPTTGPVSERCIAWSVVFGGNSRTGVAVFSPLDEGTTRVSARFVWPPSALGPDIDEVELAEDLRRFKDFLECPSAAS
jgi:hypothetical protein